MNVGSIDDREYQLDSFVLMEQICSKVRFELVENVSRNSEICVLYCLNSGLKVWSKHERTLLKYRYY